MNVRESTELYKVLFSKKSSTQEKSEILKKYSRDELFIDQEETKTLAISGTVNKTSYRLMGRDAFGEFLIARDLTPDHVKEIEELR